MGERHTTQEGIKIMIIAECLSSMAQAKLAKEKKKQQPPALPSFSARIYLVKTIIKTKQNKNKSRNLSQCLLLPEMSKHFLHFQDK